jgi:multidrug efflux pump subunit AcrB
VAIGGLVVGTLMTLIFIPVGFIWLVDEETVKES